MKNRDVIILVAILVYAAVRLYMRYGKKGKGDSSATTKTNAYSKFPSSAKGDDYEPYSKK